MLCIRSCLKNCLLVICNDDDVDDYNHNYKMASHTEDAMSVWSQIAMRVLTECKLFVQTPRTSCGEVQDSHLIQCYLRSRRHLSVPVK